MNNASKENVYAKIMVLWRLGKQIQVTKAVFHLTRNSS